MQEKAEVYMDMTIQPGRPVKGGPIEVGGTEIILHAELCSDTRFNPD